MKALWYPTVRELGLFDQIWGTEGAVTTTEGASAQDRQLLERLRRGDEKAFEEIFRTWYPTLVRIAGALLKERPAPHRVPAIESLGR